MDRKHARLSGEQIGDAVSRAATLERQRIEQLDPELVDEVAGGDPETGPTTTAGYFPTEGSVPTGSPAR